MAGKGGGGAYCARVVCRCVRTWRRRRALMPCRLLIATRWPRDSWLQSAGGTFELRCANTRQIRALPPEMSASGRLGIADPTKTTFLV